MALVKRFNKSIALLDFAVLQYRLGIICVRPASLFVSEICSGTGSHFSQKQLASAFDYLKDMRLPFLPRRCLKLYIAALACTCTFCIGRPLLAQGGFPLQGRVTNSVTGEAIRRASVQALGPRPRAALTDDEGHFRLEGLPEGEVPISVTKPGYLPEQAANPAEMAPTVARTGPDAPPIDLKLMPQSVIFGKITSAEGEPLENIPVMVIRVLVAGGRRVFGEMSSVNTNDDGEFRAANLPAGTYYVGAGPSSRLFPGSKGVANPREATYPQTFYPNASSAQAAGLVTVQAGQETEASIELKAEPVFRVSGAVTGFPEGSVGELQFSRSDRDGSDTAVPVDSGSGKFEGKIRAGTYRVRGLGGRGNWGAVGDAPLVVNSDAKGLRIPLARLPSISAKARLESAQANSIGGSSAGRMLSYPNVGISLTSRHDLTGQPDYQAAVVPGKSVVIADVEPETYRVTITTGDGQWAQSAQNGGVDLLTSDFTIAPGAHPPPIEIVLRDDVANLTGTVTGTDGVKSATALLLPPTDSRREVKTTTISPQGTFEFTGVAPGTYSVLALERTGGIEYTKREALEGYMSKAVETTLAPNGAGTVQLELARVER